jgi:2'-5' RNA ligase
MSVTVAHPRCFVGVRVTEPWQPADHCAVVADGAAGLQWFTPSALHVTLGFIGWLGLAQCRRVQTALRRLPAVERIRLLGTLRVVGDGQTRSLVAPLVPDPLLLDLRRTTAEVLGEILPDVTFGEFWPHLTVARVAPDASIREDASAVSGTLQVGAVRLFAGRTGFFQP